MKTKIVQQKKNPFLEREEFLIEIVADSTPTENEISEELGKDNDLTIIRKIKSNFGIHKFVADVIVYDTKEAKEKNLIIPQKVRKKMKEEERVRREEEKKKKEEDVKVDNEKKKVDEEIKEESEKPVEKVKEGEKSVDVSDEKTEENKEVMEGTE